MKRCISGQARIRRYGSTPKTCAVCSVSKKNPATIRNPQVTIPIGLRHQDGCSCSWFIGRALYSALETPAEKIVDGPEHQCDVPTPDEAFNEAKKVALPSQKFEPR